MNNQTKAAIELINQTPQFLEAVQSLKSQAQLVNFIRGTFETLRQITLTDHRLSNALVSIGDTRKIDCKQIAEAALRSLNEGN